MRGNTSRKAVVKFMPAIFRARAKPRRRGKPPVAPTVGRRAFATVTNSGDGIVPTLTIAGLRPIDADLSVSLSIMRTQSRAAFENSPTGRRAVRLARAHVVGPHGVALRSEPDVEAAWMQHSQRGTFDVSGRFSRARVERSIITSLLVDGEAFIQLHPRGMIEQIDSVRVPVDRVLYNEMDPIEVRMGIAYEMPANRPVGYYVAPMWGQSLSYSIAAYRTGELNTVPANQMLHVYDDALGSSRGWPHLHTVIQTISGVDRYEGAELRAAEIDSRHVGFLQSGPENQPIKPNEVDEDGDGKYDPLEVVETDEFLLNELAPGATYQPLNSGAPRTNFSDFAHEQIRHISRGVDAPYSALAQHNDASWSGLRAERMVAQTMWAEIQNLLVDCFERPAFEHWLRWAIVNNVIAGRTPADFRPILESAEFVPWQPEHLQPREEATAKRIMLEAGITSRAEIIRKMGGNPQQIFAEIQAEQAMFGQATDVM